MIQGPFNRAAQSFCTEVVKIRDGLDSISSNNLEEIRDIRYLRRKYEDLVGLPLSELGITRNNALNLLSRFSTLEPNTSSEDWHPYRCYLIDGPHQLASKLACDWNEIVPAVVDNEEDQVRLYDFLSRYEELYCSKRECRQWDKARAAALKAKDVDRLRSAIAALDAQSRPVGASTRSPSGHHTIPDHRPVDRPAKYEQSEHGPSCQCQCHYRIFKRSKKGTEILTRRPIKRQPSIYEEFITELIGFFKSLIVEQLPSRRR